MCGCLPDTVRRARDQDSLLFHTVRMHIISI
jgi:hypothetical protein